MITVLSPCDWNSIVIVEGGYWADHVARPGYNRDYAGTDLARAVSMELYLHGSQYGGKTTQAHWSTQGYGNTTFVDYLGVLRIRNAHQKNLGVQIGQTINPDTYLGTMNSTGNSTGDHTHFETWIKRAGKWQNVDPLNPANGIQIVNSVNQLVPLTGDEPMPPPAQFKPVTIPNHPKVKTSAVVTKWVQVRLLPKVGSQDIGDLRPGEIWDVLGFYTDTMGNVWYVVRNGTTIGWAAAYYMGETWLEAV